MSTHVANAWRDFNGWRRWIICLLGALDENAKCHEDGGVGNGVGVCGGSGAKVAHAGQWTLDKYEVNGKNQNASGSSDWQPDWRSNGGWGTGTGGMGGSGSGEGWVESSGKVTAVFKWNPYGPNDNPPPVLCVKVYSHAGIRGNPGTQATLDNGQGDPETAGDYNWKRKMGTHFIQVETKGQTVIRVPLTGLTLKARGTSAESGNLMTATVGMTPEAYNYWVRIKSDIEDSYKKDGTNTTPVKVERMPDGSIEVHSAVDWLAVRPGSGIIPEPVSSWVARSALESLVGGFSSPQYTWGYGGDGTGIDGQPILKPDTTAATFLDADIGPSPDPASQGTGNFGKNSTITLTVTGTDPNTPTVTSKYNIKWHLPVENIRDIRTVGEWDEFRTFGSSGPYRPDAAIGVTFSFSSALIQWGTAYINNTGNAAEFAANFAEKGPAAGLIVYSIWAKSVTDPQAVTVAQNTSDLFSNTQTVMARNPQQCGGWIPENVTGYNQVRLVEPMYCVRYNRVHKEHDKYGKKGYEGVGNTTADSEV